MEKRKKLYQGQREGVNVKSENGNDYISVSVDGLTATVATKLDFIEVDVRRVMEAIDILSAAGNDPRKEVTTRQKLMQR